MKTLTASVPYGFQELRQVQQRYMMLALLVAIIIQMMIIGAYHLSEQFKSDDPPKGLRGLPIDPSKILPPPLNPQLVSPNIAQIPTKYSAGVPVPVPDMNVNSETPDFAGQDILSRRGNEFWEQIGGVSGNVEILIEESDPLPNEYRATEIDPMVISRAIPEYPEIAKRIGMEGSVVVQVLLDKNGKVKKAQLVKASDDIFIEPALAAAQRWTFTPALMQGKPVAVWMSIPFRFRLTGK
jgi:TonB family protein